MRPSRITATRSAFTLVSRIQEEVHRYTIAYSRARHQKTGFALAITQVPGIGDGRARALFAHFGTQKAIRAASEEALGAVKGMNRAAAGNLYRWLHPSPTVDIPAEMADNREN